MTLEMTAFQRRMALPKSVPLQEFISRNRESGEEYARHATGVPGRGPLHAPSYCVAVAIMAQSLVWALIAGSPAGAVDAPCRPVEPTDTSTIDTTVKYRVRGVYLAPSDRPFRNCLADRLDVFIRIAQRFFQEEMAAEGYRDRWGQGKTFPFEMDSEGHWKVVFLRGEHETSWYHEQWEQLYPGTKAFEEMARRHGPNFGVDNVVIYMYDLATFENGGVQFAGQGGGGTPWVSAASGYTLQGSHFLGIGFDTVATRIDDQPAMFERSAPSGITDFDGNYYRHVLNLGEYSSTNVGAAVHELGHAFYLGHDFADYDGDGIENNMLGQGFRRISGRYNEKGYLPPSRLGPLQAGEADRAILFNQGLPPIELFSDDGWPGTSVKGTWRPSGASYPYGAGSVYGWEVGAAYSYNIQIPVPGTYEVALRWTGWPSRQPAVPVDIRHAAGTTTVTVDQTRNVGRWNSVASLSFDDSATVTIRAVGVGSTCADGVRLTRVFGSPPQPPAAIVVDNGQQGTTPRGSWSISGAPRPYGATSLYSQGAGASYEFAVPLPTPGAYELRLWWTQWPSRLAGVPVEVAHAGGLAKLQVNQQSNGGKWNSLGVYMFGSSAQITIRSLGGGSTCADAVQLVPTTAPPPVAVVLDNGQPGTTAMGSWPISGGPNPYGANSLYSKSADAIYTFKPSLPKPGNYEVFLWWTEYLSRLEDVRVDILRSAGTYTLRVDQTRGGGRWNSAGVHAFGSSATVRIYSAGGGTTCADAVKLVPSTASETPLQPYEAIIDNGQPETYSTLTWRASSGAKSYGASSLEASELAATYQYSFEVPDPGSYEIFLWWTELPSRQPQVPIFVQLSAGETKLVYIDQTKNGGMWSSIGTFSVAGRVKVSIACTGVGTTCADAASIVRR